MVVGGGVTILLVIAICILVNLPKNNRLFFRIVVVTLWLCWFGWTLASMVWVYKVGKIWKDTQKGCIKGIMQFQLIVPILCTPFLIFVAFCTSMTVDCSESGSSGSGGHTQPNGIGGYGLGGD